MIRIYGNRHSRTLRCLWMLEELGLNYELVTIDHRMGEQEAPEYAELNPNRHVPTLVDGELVLWESMAINLYLAERYDGGLWPGSVPGRALAYQWSLWGVTEAEPPILTALRHRVMYPPEHRDPSKAEVAEADAKKPLGVLESALTGRKCLVEDAFTVADLNVAHVISWWTRGEHDLEAYPAVDRWMRSCATRPGYGKVFANRSVPTGSFKKGWQFE